jgi:formylglycine-generating enzyme required for sulfatase activity
MPQAGYDERVGRIREVLDRQPDEIVVVTCRALDYVVKLEGLQKVEVSPLDEERIRTFLHNYLGETAGEQLFWAMAGGEDVRKLWDTWQRLSGTWTEFWTAEEMPRNVYPETTWFQEQLWERLRKEPPLLLALGRNPYLLLMTAQVYAGAGGKLPANRAKLFAAFVDTLLGREKKRNPEQWIEAELQKDSLAALAYAMQAKRWRGTTAEREWAVARLCQAVPGCDTEKLLTLATSATLLDADETTVRFYHQLLQEYFAARELGRRVLGGEALDRYWPPKRWWEPSGWEETAILLAGMEPDASALLEKLTAVNPVVAARCLVEGGVHTSEIAKHEAALALVNSLDDERMSPGARAQAGQLLARLGDPRPGVGLRPDGLPDVVWCEVQAGPFLMGSDKARDPRAYEDDHDLPQHEVTLPAYSISKYPVTNAQYAAFVQDGGYTERWRKCWTEAGWWWKSGRTGPRTYGGVFDLPNYPVVMVTWYEAVAFCRWLTERLREAGELGPNQGVALPTEAEWEKAARGQDGRIFPWGDEFDAAKCNVGDTGIGTTSAVGIFPAGASPYRALDVAGNVLEWVADWYGEDYYSQSPTQNPTGPDFGIAKVLRGGSWLYDRWDARCASRFRIFPGARDLVVGFRCARGSQ